TGDPGAYQSAILPYSAGLWTYQSIHDTNPTLDLRAGIRPGALLVAQGLGTIAAGAVSWNGTSWSLNDGTVVGGPGQGRVVPGVATTAGSATIVGPPGTFTSADVGKTINSPNLYPGTTIVSVSADGSTATVSPGAKTSGIGTAVIGSAVVSEASVFPGV